MGILSVLTLPVSEAQIVGKPGKVVKKERKYKRWVSAQTK
jgi:hypothetical protein